MGILVELANELLDSGYALGDVRTTLQWVTTSQGEHYRNRSAVEAAIQEALMAKAA